MARDYRKLRAFEYAEELALEIYRVTRTFPPEEAFGLTSQIRRSAVSVPANIVEGSQRHSEAEFLHFLGIAIGSAGETGFYLNFAVKLGYLSHQDASPLLDKHNTCVRCLQTLITSLRNPSSRKQNPTPTGKTT